MAQHKVNVGGSVQSSSATGAGGAGGQVRDNAEETDVIDVSHLRPISEGVLDQAGLHGGVDAEGGLRDLRNRYGGAVDIDPDTLPSDELHVQKLRLEHQTQGIVERKVQMDGSIVLRLIHGDGDVTTAKAATTKDALAGLIEKMGGLK